MIIHNNCDLKNYQLVAAAHTCSNQIWDRDVGGQGEETRTHMHCNWVVVKPHRTLAVGYCTLFDSVTFDLSGKSAECHFHNYKCEH